MVGEHDAARADADAFRSRRNMADQHRRCRARDSRHPVMFREPVAPVTPAFAMLREIQGVAKGRGGVAAFRDRCEVKYRKGNHSSPGGLWELSHFIAVLPRTRKWELSFLSVLLPGTTFPVMPNPVAAYLIWDMNLSTGIASV